MAYLVVGIVILLIFANGVRDELWPNDFESTWATVFKTITCAVGIILLAGVLVIFADGWNVTHEPSDNRSTQAGEPNPDHGDRYGP